MDKEQTIYDKDESTTLDEKERKEQLVDEPKQTINIKKTRPMWHTVTIGGVAGIMFGAVASGFKADAVTTEQEEQLVGKEDDDNGEELPPPVVDEGITEATSVNDEMSFSEAFASARAEVGPGGVFQWHGSLYGTCYATEWDGMTAEEKSEYGSRVSHQQQNLTSAEHSSGNEEVNVKASAYTVNSSNDEEVEVLSASLPEDELEDEDVEVEVLGVEHDAQTDMNFAYVSVDDQEVVLIDTTGDNEFDYLAGDFNNDNQITSDEVIDISGAGINVDMMGGYTDNSYDDDLMADAGTFDV